MRCLLGLLFVCFSGSAYCVLANDYSTLADKKRSDAILTSEYQPQNKLKSKDFFTLGPQPLFLVQNEVGGAFDPFIDYGEFQDNVAEEESINFFKNGRSLTISLMGGYEALSLNIRQIYGDAAVVGANISFFLDLNFAIQVNGAFAPEHYNSLFGNNHRFSHYGLDFKYYLNRQYLKKDVNFFNPYVLFGPFLINIKYSLPRNLTNTPSSSATPTGEGEEAKLSIASSPQLTADDVASLDSFNSVGVKAGLGIEFPFIKQSFIGFELSYLYTVLQFENQDLANLKNRFPPLPQASNKNLIQRWFYPTRPEVDGYKFFGDLINILVVFGLNF